MKAKRQHKFIIFKANFVTISCSLFFFYNTIATNMRVQGLTDLHNTIVGQTLASKPCNAFNYIIVSQIVSGLLAILATGLCIIAA